MADYTMTNLGEQSTKVTASNIPSGAALAFFLQFTYGPRTKSRKKESIFVRLPTGRLILRPSTSFEIEHLLARFEDLRRRRPRSLGHQFIQSGYFLLVPPD